MPARPHALGNGHFLRRELTVKLLRQRALPVVHHVTRDVRGELLGGLARRGLDVRPLPAQPPAQLHEPPAELRELVVQRVDEGGEQMLLGGRDGAALALVLEAARDDELLADQKLLGQLGCVPLDPHHVVADEERADARGDQVEVEERRHEDRELEEVEGEAKGLDHLAIDARETNYCAVDRALRPAQREPRPEDRCDEADVERIQSRAHRGDRRREVQELEEHADLLGGGDVEADDDEGRVHRLVDPRQHVLRVVARERREREASEQ
mmetsp:Transcript_8025/g.25360  ORF Transcript_8025/g.25360 Transcript_8025/m.25360 type:complete len:268 (+) Transcript_8025:127-930(+)